MTAQRFEVELYEQFFDENDPYEATHFYLGSCPRCDADCPDSDQYHSVSRCVENGGVFKCESCNTAFQILDYEDCGENTSKATVTLHKRMPHDSQAV